MKQSLNINDLVQDLMDFFNNDLLLGAIKENDICVQVCFDCNLWNYGYVEEDSLNIIIPPIGKTIVELLEDIISFLKQQLLDYSNNDYSYKSQLDRFINMLFDLKNKILAINCIDDCFNNNINTFLLSTLMETVLKLTYILQVMHSIITYSNTCGCTGSKLTELSMHKLINSISDFQALLSDWYNIVITYLSNTSMTPSHVASYVPKAPINVPPPPKPLAHACVPCPPKPQPCVCPSPPKNC